MNIEVTTDSEVEGLGIRFVSDPIELWTWLKVLLGLKTVAQHKTVDKLVI